MFVVCPRCQQGFEAGAAWVQCPRCGQTFAATLATAGSTTAMDPALLAQAMQASVPATSPMTPGPGWAAPAYAPVYAQTVPLAHVADEDLAGHAVLSVVLSVVALVGGCNPLALGGITAGLMAYAAANDRDLALARSRGRSARRLGWASFVVTCFVWAGVTAWINAN